MIKKILDTESVSPERPEKKEGFTLLEIIVTLLLIGILGAISGMGTVQATRAFLFVRESATITLDSQLALNHINRAIKNLQTIDSTNTNEHQLTITGYRDGKDVKETYLLSGTTLQLKTAIDGGSETTNILSENISDFTLNCTGTNSSGSEYAWLPTAKVPSELALIQVTLKNELSNGTTISFSTQALPRNIYRPLSAGDFEDGEAMGLENMSCFISQASSGESMNLSQLTSVLTEMSSRYLTFWSGGVEKGGPGPILIVIIFSLAAIMVISRLRRTLRKTAISFRPKGGALLGIVITMVVIGILGGAVVSIISTSQRGSSVSIFNQRAYYMSESAYRYLAMLYLDSGGATSSLTTLNDNPTYKIKNSKGEFSDSFNVSSSSFWFEVATASANAKTLQIRPAVRYPELFENMSDSGRIVVNTLPEKLLLNYSVTYDSSLDEQVQTFTFGDNQSIVADTEIYPASMVSSAGTLKVGETLTVSDSIKSFPKKNGVVHLIKINDPTVESDNQEYFLKYETADATNKKLINITNVLTDAGNIPNEGLTVTTADYVFLDKNILITATGTSGQGEYQASRELFYYQPLFQINMALSTMREDRFDTLGNLKTGVANGELGTHEVKLVSDTGVEDTGTNTALKVKTTDVKTSSTTLLANYFGKGIQESVVQMNQSFGQFDDVWSKDAKKFSYDIQVKVHFPKEKDKAVNNPLGTYMPGMLFRVRPVSTGSDLSEYYGLSIVRSIFAKGCSEATDSDDIPDSGLFDDHAQNPAISDSAMGKVCVSGYTKPLEWNDDPPQSGIPYLMIWQQAVDIVSYDATLWTKSSTGSNLLVDWLTYVPMCKVEPVTVYHYLPFSGKRGQLKAYGAYDFNANTKFCIQKGTIAYCNPQYDLACIISGLVFWAYSHSFQSKLPFDTDCDPCGNCDQMYYYTCKPSRYESCPDCNDDVAYTEGWYDTQVAATDSRRGNPYYERAYTAYKLTDTHNIFEKDTVDGKTIFGSTTSFNTAYIIRNPTTGNYVENVAYVFPNQTVTFQKAHNYRLYLKPWVTIMARVVEAQDNFVNENDVGCTSSNSTKEKVNYIQAWFGNPDVYPRGSVMQWPGDCDTCFTRAIWPDNAYNSRMDAITKNAGWLNLSIDRRLCERGADDYTSESDKRSSLLYSNQLTTPQDYADNPPSEIGFHSFGIDATAAAEADRETVYFDDFGLITYEYVEKAGLLGGFQYE